MTKSRIIILLVVLAHWVDAVWHLFLTANILPAPNNHVAWLGVTLISLGHLALALAIWKLSDKVAGWVSLVFFLAAMGADVYEHFVQTAPNNVLMVAAGQWTTLFEVSVFVLLALEILGCVLGTGLLSGGAVNHQQSGQSAMKNRQSKFLVTTLVRVLSPFGAIECRKSL